MKKIVSYWLLAIFLVVYSIPLTMGVFLVLLNRLIRKLFLRDSLPVPDVVTQSVRSNETRRVA